MRNVAYIFIGMFIGVFTYCMMADNSPISAQQAAPKSTGMTSIPDLSGLDDDELRETIREIFEEQARHIDFLHRQLKGDIDTINRDGGTWAGTEITSFQIPLMSDFSWTAPASTVTWSAGSIRYDGTDHTVAAGSATAGERWIYWESDSPTSFSDTLTPTIDEDRWYVMYYDGSNLHPTLQGTIVHAGVLQAGTVITDHMTANTINGDRITATTLTIAKLNFTPLTSSGATGAVIATINASAEGIDIEADNINIAGTTTFTSGWANATNAETDINALDLTNAPAEAGATADQTSTEIIDATGWEYTTTTKIDGGDIYTNTVLAASIGTDASLVSEIFALDITVADAIHDSHKTAFSDNDAGWWIGEDSGTSKFYFGSTAGDYLKWDGSALTGSGLTGSSYTLTGSDITCNTLTAKLSAQIGKNIADGAMTITSDGSGNTELRCCNISGSDYNIITLSGDGLECFARASSWPTSDGTISAATNDGYRTVRLNGGYFTYDMLIGSIDAGLVLSNELQCDPQASAPSTAAGSLYYNSTTDRMYACTEDYSGSLEWRRVATMDQTTDTVLELQSDGTNDIQIRLYDNTILEWYIEWDETNNTISIIENGVGTHFKIEPGGGVFMPNMESGATEPATVDAGELWYDTNNNNIVKFGT